LPYGPSQRMKMGSISPVLYKDTRVRFTIDPAAGRSTVWTAAKSGRAKSQQLFSGAGRISQVAWSPDGKWLMVAWDGADQWVFVRAGGTKAVTRSSITDQLNGSTAGDFPVAAGWAAGR